MNELYPFSQLLLAVGAFLAVLVAGDRAFRGFRLVERRRKVARLAFFAAVVFAVLGVWILGRCVCVSIALGGWEFGNFGQFAFVEYDSDLRRVVFADYPTGEYPFYSRPSMWWIGGSCLLFSVALYGVCCAISRRSRSREHPG